MSQLFVFDINEFVILFGVLLGIFIPVNIWRVNREVKENKRVDLKINGLPGTRGTVKPQKKQYY